MKNRFCSLFKNRKGAQTLEYILILTAVVILGMVLYNFMSGGELRQTLQTKMEQIFAGIVGDGAETATKEKEPEPDPKPDPKPDPPPNPKKEEKKEEEESFLDNSYVQEGTDFVLDSIPIVGNIKSLYEVASGKDIFGNELSDFDRAASGAGVLIPGAKHVKRGVKVADKGIDLVNGVKKADKGKKKPKKKGCPKNTKVDDPESPCDLTITNDHTKTHVHEGETASRQSDYKGKWNGKGLHNWDKMKKRIQKDGYSFEEILLDPDTGVRKVKIRMNGFDHETKKRYDRILEAQKTLKDPPSDKKRKQAQKTMDKAKKEDIELANNYDPKDLATSKTVDKTVYPDRYTEADIDAMGEKAFTQSIGDKKLPYSVDGKGKVTKVKFNSTVKGPDGTDIEVEGFVVPKPDGTPDYIQTHYPKFNSNSKKIVKEK